MHHIHSAVMAGKVTPNNDEARSTPHAAGLRDCVNQHNDFTQFDYWAQSEDTSRMAWLSHQFEKVGLHLYRLGDTTLMVTSMGAGMPRQLPDFRTAKAYLTLMGGVA